MKNFTAALQKGNLKPKERVLLWVHNYVTKDTTGKEVLTVAEKHALSEGWTPKDSNEAREYNRYNEGWQMEGSARLDAQTTYLNAQLALLRTCRLVDFAMWTDYDDKDKNYFDRYEHLDLDVSKDEALTLVLKHSGLSFDDTVHTLAFEGLNQDLKHDILALYPDARTESQYLDQEEAIANMFQGKDALTAEAKTTITNAIVETLHNPYAKAVEEKTRSAGLRSGLHEEWWFNSYYAELPGLAVLEKWAKYNDVNCEVGDNDLSEAEKTQEDARNASQLIAGDKSLDKEFRKDKLKKTLLAESIAEYAEKHDTDVGMLLKQTILRWLDEGLFVSECIPIWNSNSKDTCNDADTKLPHKEVLKRWITAKNEAKALVQKLIDRGELAVEQRTREILGVKETVNIITGESLYNLRDDCAFADEYKKQVEDLLPLGWLMAFFRTHRCVNDYATLLGFMDIFKRLSTIYEIDLTYKIREFIASFGDVITQTQDELRHVANKLEGASYRKHDIAFFITTFVDDGLIRLETIQPEMDETGRHYFDEFTKNLGGEFSSL